MALQLTSSYALQQGRVIAPGFVGIGGNAAAGDAKRGIDGAGVSAQAVEIGQTANRVSAKPPGKFYFAVRNSIQARQSAHALRPDGDAFPFGWGW